MSRKRPTEASWDSDDDLLTEDTYSVTALQTSHEQDDFEDELDEDALLGSDNEAEFNSSKSSGKITLSFTRDTLKSGKELKSSEKILMSTSKDTSKSGKTSTKNGKTENKRSFSPIKWDVQEKPKQVEFELEDTEEIELLVPEEDTEFDSYDTAESSQIDYIEEEHASGQEESFEVREESIVEESITEEPDEAETTNELSRVDMETTREESDESEDEGDKRGGRFKSERSNIITVSSKPSATTEIPDTLEISDEQQQQINEFMAQKDKKKKPNQWGRPFQQNQNRPNRIQTITSTGTVQQPLQPQIMTQQPLMFPPPPPQPQPSQPRPKIYMNPHFRRRGPPPTSASTHQSLPYNDPPRSQSQIYRHEEPPPRHHFDQHGPPQMDPYRPAYSQPPPHHTHGPAHPSQHFPGPPMGSAPRFQHSMEPRPLFSIPPLIQQGGYGRPQQRPLHEQYHGPPHSQPQGPPRPLFHFDGSHNQGNYRGPHIPFDNRRPHDAPGHFNQQMHHQHPGEGQQQQNFQSQPRMQHQQRNSFNQQRRPLLQGQQPHSGHQSNARFQGPRPSLQQQQSKKILQKAKKFGNIQNIPVIGRQATKRPSTDEEPSSPPKAAKIATVQSIGLSAEESEEYLKKMEEQKAARERILRQKELRRQMDAAKRRKDLEEKLAKEGKKLSELDDDQQSASSATSTVVATDSGAVVGTSFVNSGNIGRGQPQGQRGHQQNIGRGQPRGQRGHQPNIGRGQAQGQRGHPPNRGRGQPQGQRGHPPNMGIGYQGQINNRGSFAGRGQQMHRGQGQTNRGRQRGRGHNNIGRGSNVIQSQQAFHQQQVGGRGQIHGDHSRQVLQPLVTEGSHQSIQNNQHVNLPVGGQADRQVNAPKYKRMKKVVRIKRNAQGEILATETEMIPLDDGEEVATSKTQTVLSRPSTVLSSPEPDRLVVKEESTRTVIASSPVGRRNVVVDKGNESRKVQIDNLSSSTTDQAIKQMCSSVGPLQSYQRLGKLVQVMFSDPGKAKQFAKKYNRHMLDLSHISVELVPE